MTELERDFKLTKDIPYFAFQARYGISILWLFMIIEHIVIVLFHNDISPTGEQPEHRILLPLGGALPVE